MQFLLSVIDDDAGITTPAHVAATDEFNARMQVEGYWVFAAGLGSTARATTIDNRGSVAIQTDGPFAETKEHLAGIWIIDVPSLDVALELATEGSKCCNRKVEVRSLLGPPN